MLGGLLNEYVGGVTDSCSLMKGRWTGSSATRSRSCTALPETSPTTHPAVACALKLVSWAEGFRSRLCGKGVEVGATSDRRACGTCAGRQVRLRPLLRLHDLRRHDEHCRQGWKAPTRGWAPGSAPAPLWCRPRARSRCVRSAIWCFAAVARRYAHSSRSRRRPLTPQQHDNTWRPLPRSRRMTPLPCPPSPRSSVRIRMTDSPTSHLRGLLNGRRGCPR